MIIFTINNFFDDKLVQFEYVPDKSKCITKFNHNRQSELVEMFSIKLFPSYSDSEIEEKF